MVSMIGLLHAACGRNEPKRKCHGPPTQAELHAPVGSSPAARAVLAVAAGRAALEALLGLALGARDLLAGRLVDDLHGEAHLAAVVEAQQLDEDLLALLDDLVHGLAAGPASSCEMCTRPSLAPKKFTKAPNSMILTTLPL